MTAIVLLLLLASSHSSPICAAPDEKKASPKIPLGEQIAKIAKKCLGQKMWLGYGLASGYLGCAAAVSNVLKKAGVKDAHSAGVVVMRGQLIHGAHTYKEFTLRNGTPGGLQDDLILQRSQPGDVLLAFMDPPSKPNTGGNAHCGIMGDGVNVYTNDWNDGIWKYVNIHRMFEPYRYVRLLRILPETRQKSRVH